MKIASVNSQNINNNQHFGALRIPACDVPWLQKKFKEQISSRRVLAGVTKFFDNLGYDIFLKRKMYDVSIIAQLVKKGEPVGRLHHSNHVCINNSRGSYSISIGTLQKRLEKIYYKLTSK